MLAKVCTSSVVNGTQSYCTRSVAQICSDKVRIYVIKRRLLSPDTSSFLALE